VLYLMLSRAAGEQAHIGAGGVSSVDQTQSERLASESDLRHVGDVGLVGLPLDGDEFNGGDARERS
jgi:hypothetical protein